jgi:hypothetical protein
MNEPEKENKYIRLRWLLIGLILVCIFPTSLMLKRYYIQGGSEWLYWISSFSFSITLILLGMYLTMFATFSPSGIDKVSRRKPIWCDWRAYRIIISSLIWGIILFFAGFALLSSQVNIICQGCINPNMFRFNDFFITYRP